jgi:hypothetical protein
LCRDGKTTYREVHDLVLETWVGPRPPGAHAKPLMGITRIVGQPIGSGHPATRPGRPRERHLHQPARVAAWHPRIPPREMPPASRALRRSGNRPRRPSRMPTHMRRL